MRPSHDRRVVYSVATSLDGFVARDDGAVDWLFTEGDFGFDAFLASVDTVLMGRTTYEHVLDLVGDPAGWPYADKKTYVFSRTRGGTQDERCRFLDDDPADVIAALREAPGGDLWLVGGGTLASAFLAADLVDVLHLAVHPIALGHGRPVFDGAAVERRFRLTRTKPHASGLVQLEYERVRDGETPDAPAEDPSVAALWRTYLERRGEDVATTTWTYLADSFGDSPAVADELCQLVLAGRKRATACSVAELEARGEPMPRVGDHLVVLDGRGVARCIVRTTKAVVRPFDEVPPSFAAREGEGDGSLEQWKHDHWATFTRVLAPFGLAPSPSMAIVCEEFELVFGPTDLLAGLADDD